MAAPTQINRPFRVKTSLGDDALPLAVRQIAAAASGLSLLLREEGPSRIEVNPLIVSSQLAVACDVKVEV